MKPSDRIEALAKEEYSKYPTRLMNDEEKKDLRIKCAFVAIAAYLDEVGEVK